MITCHRLTIPAAIPVTMTAGAYNAFALKFSKSHPYAPTTVQEETKSDKQQECENVQEPPGHAGPLQDRKLVKGRHNGRSSLSGRGDRAVLTAS